MDVLSSTRGSLRIQQRGSSSPPAPAPAAAPPASSSGAASVASTASATADGPTPRFPKLDECAHFHYEHVDLGPLQVCLVREQDLSLGSRLHCDEAESRSYTVQVASQGKSWLLRRSYDNFRTMDRQLHRCIYDRKFSALPELPPQDSVPATPTAADPAEAVNRLLADYLNRFSTIAGNLINCGPVLSWFELDNRGRRLLVPDGDTCPINTPAVAAAYSVKRYSAQAQDEISFEVGDMISVIDMPPPEESAWWRGKRGFQVGFFPSDCVAVIGDKVPRNLQLAAGAPGSAAAAAAVCTQNMMVVRQPSKPVLRKHGKLIAFFRSFILSRPSRRRLKQSGILKERVFGCDLGEHLLNSGHDIPMVLKCCAEFIESNGIVDGIYRLSGVTSNIQKLRNAFDEDRVPALYEDEAILQDIHSVASLLKMYFRELPNPLCTYQLYHQFVGAVQKRDGAPEERLLLMREAVQKLPPPHYRTLQYLMKHLARVAERGHQTGMTPRNVAIVWAPNLLRCKALEVGGVAALQGVGVQAVVTEFLICYADLIFCERLPALSIPLSVQHSTPRRSRPKSLAISTPTKLLSLEEARTRALLAAAGKTDDDYIEVGGGPACLPAKYHTIIELPSSRKRSGSKRSPLGWKSFFSKAGRSSTSSTHSSRKSQQQQQQPRKTSTPSEINFGTDKAVTELDLAPGRRRLRPVKSAESLASGNNSSRNSTALSHGSESGTGGLAGIGNGATANGLAAGAAPAEHSPGGLNIAAKTGHNRSVSHDSYFEHLAESSSQLLHDEEEGFSSSLDLSEIQLNFDLEESEMRIFSEDETLVSTFDSSSMVSQGSPHPSTAGQSNHARDRHGRHTVGKRLPTFGAPHLAPPEDSLSGGCGSLDPSPKKQKISVNTAVAAEAVDVDNASGAGGIGGGGGGGQRKRSRLEKQLTSSAAELRFIDSQSPEQPHQMLVVQADVHKPLETPSPTASSAGQYVVLTSTSPSPADATSDYEGLNPLSSGLTTPDTPLLVYSPLREESSGSGIGSTPDYENIVSPAEPGYELEPGYEQLAAPTPSPTPSPVPSPGHSVSPALSQEMRTYENVAPIPKPRFHSMSIPDGETEAADVSQSGSASASASPSLSASTTALRQMESSGEEDTLEASRDDFSLDLNVSLDRIFPDMAMDVSGGRQRTLSGRHSDDEQSRGVYENVSVVDDVDVYEDIELAPQEATAVEALQLVAQANHDPHTSPVPAETSGDPNVIYQQVKYLRRSVHEVNALLEKDEDGNPLDDSPVPSIPTSVSLTVSASELSDNDDIEYVDKTPDSPEKSLLPVDQKGQDINYCLPEPAQASEFPIESEHDLQPEGASLPSPLSPEVLAEDLPLEEAVLTEQAPQSLPTSELPLADEVASAELLLLSPPSESCSPSSPSPPSERISIVKERPLMHLDLIAHMEPPVPQPEVIDHTEPLLPQPEVMALMEPLIPQLEVLVQTDPSMPQPEVIDHMEPLIPQLEGIAHMEPLIPQPEVIAHMEPLIPQLEGIDRMEPLSPQPEVIAHMEPLIPQLEVLVQMDPPMPQVEELAQIVPSPPPKSPEDEVELRLPRPAGLDGSNHNDRGDRTSVRELLSRFESSPMEAEPAWPPGSPPQTGSRKSDPSPVVPTERSTRSEPPRNRTTSLSTSLDEDRFLSASAAKTPLLRTQTEPDVTADRTSLPSETKNTILESACQSAMEDDPQRRERIERYKEERRSFLRKKYRSESFRDEKDETLTRLKHKVVGKSQTETEDAVAPARVIRAGVSSGVAAPQPRRIPAARSPVLEEAPAPQPLQPAIPDEVPLQAKRPPHRSSLPPLSPVHPPDATGAQNRRLSVGNKRTGVDESQRRRYTASEGEVPLRSPQRTLSATSPSYCIRDMAALFEPKENRRSAGAATASNTSSSNKQYLSSV